MVKLDQKETETLRSVVGAVVDRLALPGDVKGDLWKEVSRNTDLILQELKCREQHVLRAISSFQEREINYRRSADNRNFNPAMQNNLRQTADDAAANGKLLLQELWRRQALYDKVRWHGLPEDL